MGLRSDGKEWNNWKIQWNNWKILLAFIQNDQKIAKSGQQASRHWSVESSKIVCIQELNNKVFLYFKYQVDEICKNNMKNAFSK